MHLEPGEEVFFHGHPCWRSLAGLYLKGVLAAVIVGTLAGLVSRIASSRVEVGWVMIAVAVVFALMLARAAVRQLQTTYTITNRRLTIVSGIVSRELRQTRLERLQDVSLRQGLTERLLGVGTVVFVTAGEADYSFEFRGIEEPRRLVRTVDQALHQLQERAV